MLESLLKGKIIDVKMFSTLKNRSVYMHRVDLYINNEPQCQRYLEVHKDMQRP